LKHIGLFLTLIVFAFWGTMNSLVILREREIANLDKYRAGFRRFLGTDFLRERWMSIYRKNRKIGYTGYRFEKVFALEGVEVHSSLESEVKIEVLGSEQWVEIEGNMVADEELRPISLRLEVTVQDQPAATLVGRREEDRLALTLSAAGQKVALPSLSLEELYLGDALVPTLPVAGLRIGETFAVPCFDPVKLGRSVATVEVKAKETRDMDGLPVDAYCLETTFRDVTSKSWVTEAGELMVQELGPPFQDIVLRRSNREEAQRINKR